MSIAKERELEIRFLNEICGVRLSVEAYIASKSTLRTTTANASAIRGVSVVTHPGMLILVRIASRENDLPQSNNLAAAGVEETTLPTTGAK